jgi:exonuclease SbcC
MYIKSIDLKNVRSHQDTQVTLAPGINAIVGPNGAGKTTLIDAIGFALFDSLPYNQEHIVTEGQKTATVSITICSDFDEREYEVLRRCGNTSEYYVYDPELGEKVATGKSDVVAWLCMHLRIETPQALRSLFEQAIGVRQGQLTAAFEAADTPRRAIFDSLLEVKDFDKASDKLRSAQTYLKEERERVNGDIAAIKGELRALPGREERRDQLAKSIADCEARQQKIEGELVRIGAERDTLAKLNEQIKGLRADSERLNERVDSLKEQLASSTQSLNTARQSKDEANRCEPDYRAHLDARKILSGLEAQQAERDKLLRSLAKKQAEHSATAAKIDSLQERLVEIINAEKELAALGPLVQRQTTCEAAIKECQDQLKLLTSLQKQLTPAKSKLKDYEKSLEAIDKQLVERERTNKLLAALEQ